MSADPRLSVTSNTAKLLKHMDPLIGLQKGFVSPIMLHTMPTHRCQLQCLHCCFKGRTDKQLDLDFETYIEGVRQFHRLGVRAIELTGGGEPTLYPQIKDALSYFIKGLNLKVGLITNGLSIERVGRWLADLAWVRISLNALDYRPAAELAKGVQEAVKRTKVSFCYIWNDNSDDNIREVAAFADEAGIVCRVAPDCIMEPRLIVRQMDHIRKVLSRVKSERLFLSDFNTTITRRNHDCRIHLIKPALYTDGFIYPCPSAELAVENRKAINEAFRLCHAREAFHFYATNRLPMKLEHGCSYCKYSQQQDLLANILAETEFNDFA